MLEHMVLKEKKLTVTNNLKDSTCILVPFLIGRHCNFCAILFGVELYPGYGHLDIYIIQESSKQT